MASLLPTAPAPARTGPPAPAMSPIPGPSAGLGSGTDYDPTVLASTSGIVPASLAVGSQVTLSSTSTALRNAVTNAAGATEPLGLLLKTATDTTLSNHFIRLASNDHATLEWRPQLTILTSNRPAPNVNPGTGPGSGGRCQRPIERQRDAMPPVPPGASSAAPAQHSSGSPVARHHRDVQQSRQLHRCDSAAANGYGETSRTLSVTVDRHRAHRVEIWRQHNFGTTTQHRQRRRQRRS